MATKTINDLPELTSPASGDFVATWDISGVSTNKLTLANIYNLLLTQSNIFSAVQTIQPSSPSANGLVVNMPSGTTGFPFVIKVNGVDAIIAYPQGNATHPGGAVLQQSYDSGNNAKGPFFFCGHNTNATKPGSGFWRVNNRAGTSYRVWPDSSGNLRIGSSDPIFDNDATGTVVGTQTSSADSKLILGDVGEPLEALRAIVEAARIGLRRFSYKSNAFGGQEFEGVVTDLVPRYGMDRDTAHPAGKSLNEIQLLGDLIRAVALIADKLGLVEA